MHFGLLGFTRLPTLMLTQTVPAASMRPLHVKGRCGDGSWTQRYSESSASNHPPRNCCEGCGNRLRRGLGWASLSLRKEVKRGTRRGCPCLESLDSNLTPAPWPLPCFPRSTLAEWSRALASGRHPLPATRMRPTAVSNRPRQTRGLSDQMTCQPIAKEVPLSSGLRRPKTVPLLQLSAGFPSSPWVLNPATAFQAQGSGKAKQTFLPKPGLGRFAASGPLGGVPRYQSLSCGAGP